MTQPNRTARRALYAGVSLVTLGMAASPVLADPASPADQSQTGTSGAAAPVMVPKVSVTAPSAATEGSAEAGYLVKTTTAAGPVWGDLPLQDAPYSVHVQSQQLIENMQAGAPDQMLKTNPFVQPAMLTTLNARPTFYMRGFLVTAVNEDGLRNYNGWVNALEDVERIETLTGLSGFLYGTGNVGGLIN